MIQPSRVLLIFNSSKEKKAGGTGGYSHESAQTAGEGYERSTMLAARADVYNLIKKGGKTKEGQRLADLAGNRGLARGPDFGGTSPQGRYLPAGERYQGNFFSQLGPDGPRLLAASPSSVLILSGLYGIVTPTEPIQDYTCHFNDHPRIREIWAQGNVLSEAVGNYIQKQTVERVFDFTGFHSCRYLLDWNSIRKQVGGNVVHLFGEKLRGEGILASLGALAKEFLEARNQSDLLCLRPGQFLETPSDRIYLHSRDVGPAELPLGVSDEVKLFDDCDEVVSMARNIRRMLQEIKPAFSDKGDSTRIDGMVAEKRIRKDVADAMKNIVRWSREIECSYSFTALQLPIDWLKSEYETVLRWTEA